MGRSPRDLLGHPEQPREDRGEGWETPSLAATNAVFLTLPEKASSDFLLVLFSHLEVVSFRQ